MAPDTSTDSLEDDDPLAHTVADSSAVGGSATEPLACVSCRARKLKCDRIKPACSRCVKVNSTCVYPESRRKPTVKRRNVKELEARLAQVEDYLKEVSKTDGPEGEIEVEVDVEGGMGTDTEPASLPDPQTQFTDFDFTNASASLNAGISAGDFNPNGPIPDLIGIPGLTSDVSGDNADFLNDSQLMGLGLSESLPPMEMMEDLNRMYFATQHFYIPVVHPGRYLQAFYGGPLRKPPMCLQYAIWAQASYLTEKYGQYSEVFYMRARQYAEADEMKGFGEHFITLFHAQAYAILASFEAKSMLFTRAALTTAKCVRLVHMMGLDSLDGDKEDIPPTLGPPTCWADLEERRRTFWGAYAIDSHASISTGWPSLIQCDDITTKLPSSEEAFTAGKEEETAFLDDVLLGSTYAGFASTIVICRTFKAIMQHARKTKPRDKPDDLMNGEFWVRHRKLDNELSTLFMFLPEKLRLPANVRDPSALHINLNLHASVICLHHAAIEQAEAHGHGDAVKHVSLSRLQATAEEVANIIRMTAHNPGVFKSPLCALSMYCASTVYVYMAKQSGTLTPIDRANIEVIIQAMEAIGRTHKITLAFLQQACLDVERNNLANNIRLPNLRQYRDVFGDLGANLPLVARVAIARKTRVSPTAPFKPPLEKVQSLMKPLHLRCAPQYINSAFADYDMASEEGTTPCFRAMLGAVTRSVNPNRKQRQPPTSQPATTTTMGKDASDGSIGTNDRQNQKRRRVSPSPGPEEALNRNQPGASAGLGATTGGGFSPSAMSGGSSSSHHTHSTHSRFQAQHASVAAVLPDRTNSSASSSPMNQISVGTDTQTQSSHTSPGIIGFGLGNTAEENRVNLRSLQDRVTTPLWDQEILDSMNGGPLPTNYGGDPWGIMGTDLDWDGQVTTG